MTLASFKALDHSTRLADPTAFAQAAKAAGFHAVLRYLPLPPGTLSSDNVGRLTMAERVALHAAGLGVGVIYERDTQTHHRPLDGALAGRVDGPIARQAANALGFPPDHPIFGAADFNPTPDEYPVIADYFRAGDFDCYGNGPLLTYLASHGLAGHSWMHNWGGSGYGDPHIHQQGGQTTIAGVICDLNDVYYEDCIWWPPSQVHIQSVPAAPFKQVLHTGGNMRVDVHIPANMVSNGRGWVEIDVPPDLGVSGEPVMNGSDALLGQALPKPGWAPYQIGGGKWRVAFDGLPAGGCDIHIPLG